MAASRGSRAADFWLRHPLLDLIPASILTGLAVLATLVLPLPDGEMRAVIYGGVAAFGGLALAAATFACSMTYQSANILMTRVRDAYAADLRRNWQSIILWMLASAVLPILGALVDSASVSVGLAMSLGGLAVIVIKAVRAMFWLGYTLFMDEVQQAQPRTLPAPKMPDRPSART